MRNLVFLFICVLIGGFSSDAAHAEYRMFTLRITNTQTQDVRLVNSTLDPIQYRTYYPVKAEEQIVYTDTWRCYGRTDDFKPPCPSPRAPAEAPAEQQNQGPATPPNP